MAIMSGFSTSEPIEDYEVKTVDQRIDELQREVERLRGALGEVCDICMPQLCELCEGANKIAEQALSQNN